MSFKIIKAETRISTMLQWFVGIQKIVTDTFIGGVTRSKLESVAVEMEQQDFAFYKAITKAIPTSVYRAFNFPREDAVRASGEVTLSVPIALGADVVIPKGTTVSTVETETVPERVYETIEETTLVAGQTDVDTIVICTQPGTFGNTGVDTITVLKTVSGVDSVTNASAFDNGREKETEESRRVRFVEYVSTLARGTEAAVAYGAKTAVLYDGSGNITEQVISCLVVDKPRATAGFTDVFIFNGSGSTSAELITEAQKIVDGYIGDDLQLVAGWKAAGIVATVYAADEISQDVTMTITSYPGSDTDAIETKAETIIDEYIKSLNVSDKFIVSEIIERIMGINGVYNVAVSVPSADVTPLRQDTESFTGTGLDDMTRGGTFTGNGKNDYLIEIDGTGTPDTFRWSNDGGDSWEEETVSITGAAQVLEDGVTVTFAATTGHTSGDQWDFVVSTAAILLTGTLDVTVDTL